MNFSKLLNRLMQSPWSQYDRKAMDILAAFIHDAEHEMKTVITALQAHIDLWHHEQSLNYVSQERYGVLNRAVARLISDTNILAAVTELTTTPQVNTRIKLQGLIEEITDETRSNFREQDVFINANITSESSLNGSAIALKLMLKETVLALLQECKKKETISITGQTEKKGMSLIFETGADENHGKFEDWQLGKLRLNPSNGEGISLAAVDAIARMHRGQLAVKTSKNQRHEYRLLFSN